MAKKKPKALREKFQEAFGKMKQDRMKERAAEKCDCGGKGCKKCDCGK